MCNRESDCVRERQRSCTRELVNNRQRASTVDSPRGLEALLSVGERAGLGARLARSLAENDMTFLFGIPRGHYSITGKVSRWLAASLYAR